MEFNYVAYFRDGTSRVAAIVPAEERAARPALTTFTFPLRCDRDGRISPEERARVERLEDEILERPDAAGAIWAGHVSSPHTIVAAYYGPSAITQPVKRKVSLLKSETILPEYRADPAWTWYATQLEPTDLEEEASRNAMVLDALHREGDDGRRARETDFFVDLPSAASADAFVKEAHGYTEAERMEEVAELLPIRVRLTANVVVTSPEIDERTLHLRRLAARHGGEFDGWGCPLAP